MHTCINLFSSTLLCELQWNVNKEKYSMSVRIVICNEKSHLVSKINTWTIILEIYLKSNKNFLQEKKISLLASKAMKTSFVPSFLTSSNAL